MEILKFDKLLVLNSQKTTKFSLHFQICSNYFICQSAEEASKMGGAGQILAKVASSNAESWLTSINATLHKAWNFNIIFEMYSFTL